MRKGDPSLLEKLSIRCRRCGYSLHGLRSRACPECGQAFDPADPATMRVVMRPSLEAWRRWMRSVAVVFAAVLLPALLVVGMEVVQQRLGLSKGVFRSELALVIDIWITAALLLALLLVMLTMIVAWRFRGVYYALHCLFVIICLMPVGGIGVLLVPLVIDLDIQREVRQVINAWPARSRGLENQPALLMQTIENGRT